MGSREILAQLNRRSAAHPRVRLLPRQKIGHWQYLRPDAAYPGPAYFHSLNVFRARSKSSPISEVTCEYWQVLCFIVFIGMYGGMYCGTYWYVLRWFVL